MSNSLFIGYSTGLLKRMLNTSESTDEEEAREEYTDSDDDVEESYSFSSSTTYSPSTTIDENVSESRSLTYSPQVSDDDQFTYAPTRIYAPKNAFVVSDQATDIIQAVLNDNSLTQLLAVLLNSKREWNDPSEVKLHLQNHRMCGWINGDCNKYNFQQKSQQIV